MPSSGEKQQIRRTRRLILARFQLRYASFFLLFLLLAALFIAAILIFLLWSHFSLFIREELLSQQELFTLLRESGKWIFIAGGVALFLFIAVTFWILILLSHRIAGPVFAITRRFEALTSGDYQAPFGLRASDALQEIKEDLNVLLQKYRSSIEDRLRRLGDLDAQLVQIGPLGGDPGIKLEALKASIRQLSCEERTLLYGGIAQNSRTEVVDIS